MCRQLRTTKGFQETTATDSFQGVIQMLRDKLQEMREAGFCVLEQIIPEDCCESIRQSVAAAATRAGDRDILSERSISFLPGLINHDQSFADYLAHPQLLELLSALLGEHIRVSFTSAIINQTGNERGEWHADWPFNQKNAGRIPAPYPDVVMHITTLWMLSPFSQTNGGTLVVPGSHRKSTNPTAPGREDSLKSFPTETVASGQAGSVLVFDSRLWHASAPNSSKEPRVALAVRYAPWWLTLDVLRPDSEDRRRMVDEPGAIENRVPPVPRAVFERLPQNVKPLFRHWLAR